MEDKEMAEKIDWQIVPKPPVPGLYYVDMIPDINLKTHDPSADDQYCKIHTPYLEFFPIDYMEELRTHFQSSSEPWLRNSTQIDAEYYRCQSERMGALRRDEDNDFIEDVFDYRKYVESSFNEVDEDVEGFEIEEEYPIYPSFTEEYFLAHGDIKNGDSFKNIEGGTSLINRNMIRDQEFECVKQSCTDNIIIEINEGMAFYSIAHYVYRFKKIQK